MKNRYKNIILIISMVGNVVVSIIAIGEFKMIKEMATIMQANGLLDSYSDQTETSKEEKILTEEEYVDALGNVMINIPFLSLYIGMEDFDSYKKRSPEVVKKLNNIISFTKDEKFKKELISIKAIIEGRPKEGDFNKCSKTIIKYYTIYKKRLDKKKREDFYNGKP